MKLTAPLLVLVIEMDRNGTLAGGSAGLEGGVFLKESFFCFNSLCSGTYSLNHIRYFEPLGVFLYPSDFLKIEKLLLINV